MNPHRDDPIHVEAFGKFFALVETLGVISTHRTKAEAEEALAQELAQRARDKAREDEYDLRRENPQEPFWMEGEV